MKAEDFLIEEYGIKKEEITSEVLEDAINYANDLYILTDNLDYIDIETELYEMIEEIDRLKERREILLI